TDDGKALADQLRDDIGDAVDSVELRPVGGSDVVDELLRESRDSSLLAIGSRGLGGFKGLLLGSISHRCLEVAPLPVAIVREY
ncbi:MAG: universal stress protein, partial [Acidimicrobiales bacterium]